MAARATTKTSVTLAYIGDILKNKGAVSRETQIPIGDVANLAKMSTQELMNTLDVLDPEGEVIDGDRGFLFVDLAGVVTPPAPAKRGPGRPRKAAQPIKGGDGKNITVPVSEGSEERRELDASKGERLIAEGDMRALINSAKRVDTPATQPVESSQSGREPQGKEIIMDTWNNDGGPTHFVEYDQASINGHMILPAPDSIPAPPEGVNANMWELYKAAETLPARIFWGRKVAEQIKAHAERKEAEKIVPNAPAVELPIDPVTGERFPF